MQRVAGSARGFLHHCLPVRGRDTQGPEHSGDQRVHFIINSQHTKYEVCSSRLLKEHTNFTCQSQFTHISDCENSCIMSSVALIISCINFRLSCKLPRLVMLNRWSAPLNLNQSEMQKGSSTRTLNLETAGLLKRSLN